MRLLHLGLWATLLPSLRAQDRPAPTPAPAAAPDPHLRLVRGKRLHVEVVGPASAPALLYLHGGPGTGSYDFLRHQQARLAPSLRLIALDQRGVLRSDPLVEGEAFGLADLVEDCEALRRQLGIPKWTVLGHSFGGYLAVSYALKYPEAIEGLIFENPTFDFASSARELLRGIAERAEALGNLDLATEARAAAEGPLPPAEQWRAFSRAANRLGEARQALYVHGPDKDFFNALVRDSGIPGERWAQGHSGPHCHQARLYAEGQVFTSLQDQLGKLTMPALLIRGRHDRVTAPDQVRTFERTVPQGRTVIFEQSAHFVRFEEPERYARTVLDFVLRDRGPKR